MSSPFNSIRHGCQVGIEAAYLAPYTFGDTTAADAVRLKEKPSITRQPEFDGDRSAINPGTAGGIARVAPGGFFAEATLMWEPSGPGVAYTASKFMNGHRIVRGAGLSNAFSVNRHDYTPTPDGSRVSLALRAHLHGLRYDLTGSYVRELRISAESGRPLAFEADLIGVCGIPTQVPIPTLGAYTGTDLESLRTMPPKFEAGQTTLNGVSIPRVRSFSATLTNDVEARGRDQSTGLHGGFSIGRRTVLGEIFIEQLPLATFNPRALADAGTLFPISVIFGAGTGNELVYDTNSLATCQIVDVDDDSDNASAMTRLELQFSPTTPNADDELRLITR